MSTERATLAVEVVTIGDLEQGDLWRKSYGDTAFSEILSIRREVVSGVTYAVIDYGTLTGREEGRFTLDLPAERRPRPEPEPQVGDAHAEVVTTETGDAHGEIDSHMRSRLDDIALLVGTAEGKGEGWADPDKLEALGIEDKHADPEIGTAEEEAQERLIEYPLAVERTIVFEVVIGTNGPDDRLIFECSAVPLEGEGFGGVGGYEIDRVLYRYSWEGSAERVLSGEDRKTAEELARRVVPELVE